MKSRVSTSCALAMMLLSFASGSVFAQQIAGVGVVLAPSDQGCRVMQVVHDSPAEASGLVHTGDRIIAVAQADDNPVSTAAFALPQLVDLIRGPANSVVRLTIVPAGKTDADAIEVRLTRSNLKLPAPSPNARAPQILPRERPGFWASLHISWNTLVLVVAVPIVLIYGWGRFLRKNR